MSEHWSVAEYREYLRTGKEPERRKVKKMPAPEKPEGYGGKAAWADEKNSWPVTTCCAGSTRKGVEVPEELPETGVILSPDTLVKAAEKRRNKYGNHPVEMFGKRFDSIHEARVYQELMIRVKAGELRCVIRQVRFDLAETERLQYVADFVTVDNQMRIEVLDAKSEATRKNKVYVIKKKLMREKWGIEIAEV